MGHNVEQLEELIAKHIPEGMHHFPEDQLTDKSSRFMAAEMVREKLMRNLGDEIPYGTTVEIEEFKYAKKRCSPCECSNPCRARRSETNRYR